MLTKDKKTLCDRCFKQIAGHGPTCPDCKGKSNTATHSAALKEGSVLLGKYAVGKLLGKGGFGMTYLCYDLNLDKPVAVKEFFPESLAYRTTGKSTVSTQSAEKTEQFQTSSRKFYEEASLVSRFNGNPNIISVHEFFYENNTAYFVMEYLDGFDFKHYINQKGRKIPEGEAIYITDKVLDALLIVHSMGILHRDISPDNIYMCSDGNVKLIDFGAARQVVGEESKSLSVILKTGFAPLEQYQKRGNQGPWTDIYALGATLYYSLTGIVIDDAMSRLDDPSLKLEGISPELAQVLTKMLAVRVEDRYKSAVELKADIAKLGIPMVAPGIKIDEEKHSFCIYCGKIMPFGIEVCKDCQGGAAAATTAGAVAAGIARTTAQGAPGMKITEAAQVVNNNKKSKIWLIPVLVALICAIGIGVAFALGLFNKEEPKRESTDGGGNIGNDGPRPAISESVVVVNTDVPEIKRPIFDEVEEEETVQTASGVCGNGINWTYDGLGLLTLSGSGEMYDYNVTNDGILTTPWANYITSINSIVVEEGITSIGDFAFAYCSQSEVALPSTVTDIGRYAFVLCQNLETINLGEGVTTIGENAFTGDTNISSITIPASVESMGYRAFSGWSGTQTITLGVTKSYTDTAWNGQWAEDCYAVIEYMEEAVVECAHEWGDTKYSTKHPHYGYHVCKLCGASEGVSGTTMLSGCRTCYPIAQEAHTHSYGPVQYTNDHPHDAFRICSCGAVKYEGYQTKVDSCTICNPQPAAPTYAGYCGASLAWKYDEKSGVLTITGTGKMSDDTWNESTAVPWYQFGYNVRRVEIGEGVTAIGQRAFATFSKLESVSLPSTLTTIGKYSFYQCTSLRTVTIPANVTVIDNYAFNGCSSLTAVIIPDGITSGKLSTLGQYAFADCARLSNITLPYSLSEIKELAFKNCTSLKDFTIPPSVTSVKKGAFSGFGSDQVINVSVDKQYTKNNWNSEWLNNCNAKVNYNG